jgi:hypothetical protein
MNSESVKSILPALFKAKSNFKPIHKTKAEVDQWLGI